MVSEENLNKFIQLYSKKYGISLSDKDATEQATAFLHLMKILLEPPRYNVNTN